MRKPEFVSAILVINAGSSSIKFALYPTAEPLVSILRGRISRIGLSGSNLQFKSSRDNENKTLALKLVDRGSAGTFLIDWLTEQDYFASIRALGHRVVHGMSHILPELVTEQVVEELRRISPCDPEHMPREIELIEAFRQRHPEIPQIVCFDTAFHAKMPRVAKLLAIPRRFADKGIQRYGFHGLSYAYLMEELRRLADPAAAKGCVILAHLGSGASLAAVRDGQSIDTSMGFTPASGLPMSSRSGDLDPGLMSYLVNSEHMSPSQFHHMINSESGLLGISETSDDMQDLLDKEASDIRCAEAVALFCYQVKKWIGAFAAALGGIDTLVFTGGIGANSPVIRSRICEGLAFLGVELEDSCNEKGEPIISSSAGRVMIRIVHTDEELMLARALIDEISI